MILVDTADPLALTECLSLPGVGGITTNPTLIAHAAGRETLTPAEYQQAVNQLLAHIEIQAPNNGRRRIVMVQATGPKEAIVTAAAEWRCRLPAERWDLWIKLLPTWEHLDCIRGLRDRGLATLVTAIFTARQTELALEAGADGVAVYVGRLQKADPAWTSCLAQTAQVASRRSKLLLLAGFPDLATVDEAIAYSGDLTLRPALLTALPETELSLAAIRTFQMRVPDSL